MSLSPKSFVSCSLLSRGLVHLFPEVGARYSQPMDYSARCGFEAFEESESDNESESQRYKQERKDAHNLRTSLEKVLSATHGSIVRSDNNPPWMIPSDHLHELQSILTQWNTVSPNSSNKPDYLAYPLDTPIDGKKFMAPGPHDLFWCDRSLIPEIERVCDGMDFSIFLARYER
jgi:hypothetical protein